MNWESQGLRLGSNRKLYMGMWGGVKGRGRWRGTGRRGGEGRQRGMGAREGVRGVEQGIKLCPSSSRRPYHGSTFYSES